MLRGMRAAQLRSFAQTYQILRMARIATAVNATLNMKRRNFVRGRPNLADSNQQHAAMMALLPIKM